MRKMFYKFYKKACFLYAILDKLDKDFRIYGKLNHIKDIKNI